MSEPNTNVPERVCELGEPMMHGPRPYRWCKVHNDLMHVCDEKFGGRIDPPSRVCGVVNHGGEPCTKPKGHPKGHDEASYGSRVCQRGVDGSAGCGHNNTRRDGSCKETIRPGTIKNGWSDEKCEHRCDFSPAPPTDAEVVEMLRERKRVDPGAPDTIAFGTDVPPVGDGTHEPLLPDGRHAFIAYKGTAHCGVMIDAYARCGLLATNGIHLSDDVENDQFVPLLAMSQPHEFIKPSQISAKPPMICELCSKRASAPVHRVAEAQCAGLEGCHGLEGVMYDLFVHDPACPKGKTKPFSEISRELKRKSSTEPQRRTSVPEPPAMSERQCEADSCPFDMPRPHLIRHHPTYMEHCDWCNQNYDVFTRSIHCPHNVKPQPAAPAISELGAFWVQWFKDVGAHGTMDVIHATTKLVIAEREIAVRDHLEPIRKAIEACEAHGQADYSDAHVLFPKRDWDALVALVKENHDEK